MQIYNYILLIYVFVAIYHSLTIYQQAHYEITAYLRYIKRHALIEIYSLFLLAIICVVNNIFICTLCALVLSLSSIFLYKKKRVRLKITNRIKRLFLILFPAVIISIYFYPCAFFIRYYIVLFMILSNIIERIINKKYHLSARKKLKKYDGICIGITGSFGKTTTKYYLNHLLSSLPVLSTIKSYNTLNGISMMINNNDLYLYDYLILEMGSSRKGDIKKITNMFFPSIGIVTSIGYMHLNTFKTIENIIEEKMSLINSLPKGGLGIINYENEYIRYYNLKSDAYVLTYGLSYGDFRAKINEVIDIYYLNNKILSFNKNDLSQIDILNLMPCIILSFIFGIPKEEIIKQIYCIKRPPSRQEIRRIENSIIIDDSYNSNLEGAIFALDKLKSYDGKKVIITPGIVENDKVLNKLYDEYSKKINEIIDVAYIVRCSTSKLLFDKIDVHKIYVNSVNDALKLLDYKKINAILIENDIPDIYV